MESILELPLLPFQIIGESEFLSKLTLSGSTIIVILVLLASLKAPFSPKVKAEVRARANGCSEVSGQPETHDDRLQIHHIKAQHEGGNALIENAIAVLESEHRLIHILIHNLDMRKLYKPSIIDCTPISEDSVLYWLQHTGQMIVVWILNMIIDYQNDQPQTIYVDPKSLMI